MNGKIYMRRDQIQFERLPYPDDGNSYVQQAAHTWECAATVYIESAGYKADVSTNYSRDHHRFRLVVLSTEEIETDDGRQPVGLTDEEYIAAYRIGRLADETGWAAAIRFAQQEASSANPD